MAFLYKVKTYKIFNPESKEPFELSRSKIDLFLECARCFYLDRRLGIGRPDSFPFTLNNAVDALLKKEFDIHRKAQSKHPLLESYGLDAVPLQDDRMDEWRDALRNGIKYLDKELNLIIRSGIDDVWVNPEGEIIIADYKATSKADAEAEINLDAEWQIGYKRQMEVYQWLFRQNGFKVSETGYFVYVNGKQDREAFDAKLEFDVVLLPYKGDPSWIPETLKQIKQCLLEEKLPNPSETCQYCAYRKAAAMADANLRKKK
jgi:CRISPR/Cas system-associated exonuclease Cas4 (RecB family)